jgi:signal transduction histidine kinase
MGIMTKLLNRPLKAFTIYSLIILIISIPAYYLVVDYIWLEELDEHNLIVKERIIERFDQRPIDTNQLEMILDAWNTLQPGTSIHPTNKIHNKDSMYEVTKMIQYGTESEIDRFRGLQSFVEINGLPYRITIETNVEEADETLLAIAIVTFFFFIVLILGFIALNRRIAVKSWNPFYATLDALKKFDLSKDKKIELNQSDIFEFQELNESLNRLVERNISTYQQQKSFTENASHELQTPIALLKSKLDLLHQEEDVTPGISRILSSVEAPLSRLSRINKNLLLLAKVENHQFEELENIQIKKSVESAISLFEDFAKDKNIEIQSSIDSSMTISANPFLFETLTNNLLSNGIKHSPPDSQIDIVIKNNQFVISNSGPKTLAAENLFKRFSAATTEVVGSGLGLAIVKEIANQYDWDISYSFQDAKHTFSLTF